MTLAQATAVAVESQVPAASFNFQQAIEDNLPMAKRMAKSAFFRWGCNFDQDDLEGYANLGLVNAATQYDITKAADFTGFANVHIRWALSRGRDEMAVLKKKNYKAAMAGKMKKPTFIHEGGEGKFSLASALVSDDSREIEQRDASEDISSMLTWLQGHNPQAADLMRLVLQGKSIPQIAALQGKNVLAVHSQYHRALVQWRKQFKLTDCKS